jgi:hypothetical protein
VRIERIRLTRMTRRDRSGPSPFGRIDRANRSAAFFMLYESRRRVTFFDIIMIVAVVAWLIVSAKTGG